MAITEARVSKETLEDEYLKQRLSLQAMAKVRHCSYRTIRRHLTNCCIPVRTISEASQGKHLIISELTPEELSSFYYEKGYSQIDIAEQFGVHEDTIRSRMKEYGIITRPKSAPRTRKHIEKRTATITARKLKVLEQIKGLSQRDFELTPDYIVGLTDGEGCFSIYIDFRWNPPVPQCEFNISNKNRQTLHMIKGFFGFGSVCPSGNRARTTCYQYTVGGITKQIALAKFFLEHPLSIRKQAFRAWLRVLNLIAENKHITEEGLRE
ncbi:unnamed protein product, partial [marine sediment metagenome]